MTAAQDRTKFWRAPNLGNIELLHATYIKQRFVPHVHEEYAVGVVEQGVQAYFYRGANYTATQGSIVNCNPDEVHTGHAVTQTGWTYRMFYVAADLMCNMVSEMTERPTGTPFFRETIIHDPHVASLLRRLHLLLEHSPFQLEHETAFLLTFAELIQRHVDGRPRMHPAGSEKSPVAKAQAYMQENYHHNITLDELAQITYLSPFYFARVFRRSTGLPPHAYLLQVRVSRAKKLLAAGFPVSQVAVDTGFADQSHFTKRFRRIVGVTPGQYQQKRKNRQDG